MNIVECEVHLELMVNQFYYTSCNNGSGIFVFCLSYLVFRKFNFGLKLLKSLNPNKICRIETPKTKNSQSVV